jgi:hypothetical protein
MAIYFIAYNLAKPGQNGKNLWDVLTALGARRIQDSVWILRSHSTAAQIRGWGAAASKSSLRMRHIQRASELSRLHGAER